MNVVVALATVVGFAVAAVLLVPALRRTRLAWCHPALLWLGLAAIFFGLGSARLALDARPGPALFVTAGVLAFALGVAASDRLASRRAAGVDATETETGTDAGDPARARLWVVVGLAILALAAIAPTLWRVGLPFLAGDITGARSELTGLSVQGLRVALPALALTVILATHRARRRNRVVAWAIVIVLLAFDLVLASRYLAAELAAIVLVGIGLARWRIPVRTLAAVALLAVVAFGGVQILRAYDQAAGREVAFAIGRTVDRVVLIQPRTLEALQQAIPSEQPYFGGLTWVRRLGPLVGRDDIPNLGYWIYLRMFPDQVIPGYAAPGVFGEAWANVGPAGLALLAAFGVAVERLGALIARRRIGTGDIVAGAMAAVFVARTHALGANGLLVLLALVAAWRFLAAPGVRAAFTDMRATLTWRT